MFQRRRGNASNNAQDVSVDTGECDEEVPNSVSSPGSLSSPRHDGGSPMKRNAAANVVSPSHQQREQDKRRRYKGKRRMDAFPILLLKAIGLFSILFLVALIVVYTSAPPRLPLANVDVPVPSEQEWPLIHIVNTRFMQEQGPLETLGMARFHLFMTFCFPTMVAQSTQKFFWIIKTDPKFTKTPVFDLLLQAAQNVPHKNIYVVTSNNNFLQHPDQVGSWIDGAECMDLLKSKIYTGNVTKLHQAMALRNERPVLETRLDADDGLHMHYLKYIQVVALQRFKPKPSDVPKLAATDDGVDIVEGVDKEIGGGSEDDKEEEAGDESEPSDEEEGGSEDEAVELYLSSTGVPPPPRWLYWCTRRHLEWHNALADTQEMEDYGDGTSGFLAPIQHEKLCVTPGMTVGFNVGVDPKTVPVHAHDELVKKVGDSDGCYNSDIITSANEANKELLPCLDLVEELVFCAIRSRTFMSAGMRNVGHVPPFPYTKKLTEKFWQLLKERFSITKTKSQQTKEFLHRHQREIAIENLKGQCTSGHSCKDTAKAELEKLMKAENAATPSK